MCGAWQLGERRQRAGVNRLVMNGSESWDRDGAGSWDRDGAGMVPGGYRDGAGRGPGWCRELGQGWCRELGPGWCREGTGMVPGGD